jgi:DNA-binding NarL/FixJ family response regulator
MSIRVVIGEDQVLLREGIAEILDRAGLEVVAQAGNAEDFLRRARAHKPDVAVVDIQMPPDYTDDGLRAALALRSERPQTGVVVLSQFFEEAYAVNLIGDHPEGVGYLLKERVGNVSAFVDAVSRVAAGGTALDPDIVARMIGRRRERGPLEALSPRDREVLSEMAEGKSNRGIAETLYISEAAVEKHVGAIFRKLGIDSSVTGHRRVLAVVRYLRESEQSRLAARRDPTGVP